MKSLFNKQDNREIIDRINKLTPETQRVWGTMSVDQMLAHCQPSLKVALGELKLKHSLIGKLFGKIAKRKLVDEKPFKKSLPTAPEFKAPNKAVFNEEKTKLINLLERFQQAGPEGLMKAPHPFFGPLTEQEWDILQWKHLDHHLRQFGC
jgi:hypothetical protein